LKIPQKKFAKGLEKWFWNFYLCTRFERLLGGGSGESERDFGREIRKKGVEKFGGGKKVLTFAAPNRRVRREKRRVGTRRERRGDIQMFFDTLAPTKRKRNRK